uniref:(northern house mosquito) hypothetical protein n=1 Tax=Culex pipiens TaxID=7175 RepID=A0A8D8DVD5_CULPI
MLCLTNNQNWIYLTVILPNRPFRRRADGDKSEAKICVMKFSLIILEHPAWCSCPPEDVLTGSGDVLAAKMTVYGWKDFKFWASRPAVMECSLGCRSRKSIGRNKLCIKCINYQIINCF